jgi:hypothetical protein
MWSNIELQVDLGLAIMEICMEYESPIAYHPNEFSNVKVFKKLVKLQGQGQEVINCGTIRKGLL